MSRPGGADSPRPRQAPQASRRALGSEGRRAGARGEGRARQDPGQAAGKMRRFSLTRKQLDNLFWIDLEAAKWKKNKKKQLV